MFARYLALLSGVAVNVRIKLITVELVVGELVEIQIGRFLWHQGMHKGVWRHSLMSWYLLGVSLRLEYSR